MKKFFSAILLMAAMAFSVSTFVSCNDLTDEMEGVKTQATQNAAAIDALETQITALQTALATAQSTADAAKKAGEDAAAAAAQAKADAIKEAKAECELAKAALEAKISEVNTALAGKVSKEELDAAVAAATKDAEALIAVLGAKIEGIEAELNKLGDFATKAELSAEVEKLLAADKDLQIQIDALEEYMETLTGAPAEDYVTVEEAKAEAEAVREMLAQLAERANGLEGYINSNSGVLETLVDTVDIIAAALEGYIESNDTRVNEIAKAVAAAGEDVAAIEEALKAYIPETDSKIAGLAQSIADVNALLDETVEQVAERIGAVESQMNTYYKALNAASEDLAAELAAVAARVEVLEAGLKEITPKVEALAENVNTISAELNTLKTLLSNLLRSIVFAPETIVDGVEAIDFWSIAYLPMKAEKGAAEDVVTDPNSNKKDALSVAAPAYAYYHFNPSSFDLEQAYYTLLDRSVTLKSGVSSLAAIEAYDYAENGTVEFTLRRENIFTETKANMIALEATVKNEEATIVRSDYALVNDIVITPDHLFIADKAQDKIGTIDHLHFATTFADATNADYVTEYTLVWNKTLDLLPLIETCFENETIDLAEFGLSYRFAVASQNYKITSGATSTNQQTVIECTDALNGTFKVKDTVQKEAIGRTPLVKVEIVDAAGNIVRRAYVKILVDVERAKDLEFGKDFGEKTYVCTNVPYIFTLDEEYMRGVYRVISNGTEASLSHEEFWNLYELETSTVTKNGKAYDIEAPEIVPGETANGTATKKIQWSPSIAKVGELVDGALFEAEVVLKNKISVSEYPAHVTFNLSFTMVLPSVYDKNGFAKNEEYWDETLTSYVVNPSIPANPQDVAENFYYERNLLEAFVNAPVLKGATCANGYFRLAAVTPLAAGKGVGFENNIVTLDKNSDAVKAALNDGTLTAVFEYVAEFVTGDIVVLYTFPATFVKPVHFNLPAGLEVTDALDGGDTIEFGWNGLVSDWRGFGIISPTTTEGIEVDTYYAWKKTCDKNHYTEGYYRLANEPKVEPVYGEYVLVEEERGYTASVEAKRPSFNMVDAGDVLQIIASMIGGATWEELATNGMGIEILTKTFTSAAGKHFTSAEGAVADLEAAIENANLQIEGSLQAHWKPISKLAYWRYDETAVAVKEDILVPGESIKYVKDFIVVLPEYEYVEPELKPCTPEPDYTPTEAGILEGCWTSVEMKNEIKVEVDVPGAYYNFYGPFNGPVLDLAKAYTDLEYNGGELPSGVTLVQDGTSVKYVNVGSPVRYAYNIYIPATMEYGFGILKGELVIKVNPINE